MGYGLQPPYHIAVFFLVSVMWMPKGACLVPTNAAIICAVPYLGMSNCNTTTPSYEWTGYDIQAFRDAATMQGWTEGLSYTFRWAQNLGCSPAHPPPFRYARTKSFCLLFCRCMPEEAMLLDLISDDGSCLAGVGGIAVTAERAAARIQFSYPTYRAYLAALVAGQPARNDGWSFMRVFTRDVW
jgi:hypothetical protein